MHIEQTEALWLHEQYTFTLGQLSELSGLTERELREMVDYGILSPMDSEAAQWVFGADRLLTVRMAKRLSRDFDLNAPDLALVITLMDRIHALEEEVSELRAKLPGIVR